jgi:outer membrane protein OmpA-like peptidoglycan-associated protein
MKRFLLLICLFIGFSVSAQQFSPRYELVKLGKQVNTFYHEAAPVVSPDGKDLYFFVSNHPENSQGKDNTQDIWVSHKDDKGEWSQAQHMGSPFNQHKTNQVFTVFPDGSLLIRGGRGRDEIGFSIVSKGGGTTELNVKDFKTMSKGRFYGATMSSDQKHMILYFSEAPQAIKSDLYISHAEGNGDWSRPVKLKITDGSDEFGPFLAPDNKTLFFASDRSDPKKQGGADIYKSERLDDSWNNWSKPQNLFRPINTAAGDAYFTVDAAGNVFTSRANSRVDGGNLDIFVLVPKDIKVMLAGQVLNEKTQTAISAASVVVSYTGADPVQLKSNNTGNFETRIPEIEQYKISASAPGFLPKELTASVPTLNGDTTLTVEVRLTPVAKKLIVMGTVFDKKTEAPIKARIEILPKSDKRNVTKLDSDDGKFSQEVSKLGWYILTASAEGYINATDSVQLESEDLTPVTKDLYLQPIEVGLTVRLKNIYFDFDKTTLKSESFVELNKVVEFLKTNSHVEIEISGHTDSKGSDEYNANLSQGRSQSVVDYLVSQGIDRERLSAHGYGESKPIDTNETEEGRANNRRVEFTVVKT